MNANPFLIIAIILNLCTSGWYFFKGGPILGLLFLGYAFCSIVTLFLGVK
jgi:hypothetical protein